MLLSTARYTMPLLEILIKRLTFDHEQNDDSKSMYIFLHWTWAVSVAELG